MRPRALPVILVRMAMALSLLGIVVGLIGGGLLYVFHDPRFNDAILVESANLDRDKIGARAGLALVAVGAVMQFVAVVVAKTEVDSETKVDSETARPQIEEVERPTCAEQFAEGVSTDAALRELDQGCVDEDGDLAFFGSADLDCLDGRELNWNDEGWGYRGDVWHRHVPGAELVAPEVERRLCTGEDLSG